jgi:hypothetical protein
MKKVPVKKKEVSKRKLSLEFKPDKHTLKNKKKSIIDSIAFHPDLLKNDLIRQTIITILWRREEATMSAIKEDLVKEIGHHFDGDIERYIEHVKSDLEKRKLLEESPGKLLPHYRLAQKLQRGDQE